MSRGASTVSHPGYFLRHEFCVDLYGSSAYEMMRAISGYTLSISLKDVHTTNEELLRVVLHFAVNLTLVEPRRYRSTHIQNNMLILRLSISFARRN